MDRNKQSTSDAGLTTKIKRLKSTSSTTKVTKLSKESFLKSIDNLKLYVEGDKYYEQAKIDQGPLRLEWT